MSRDIRFRVWNDLHKEYEQSSDIAILSGVEGFTGGFTGRFATMELGLEPDHIVEQYTGVQDFNGVDIYEGDILEFPAMLDGNNVGYCSVFFQDGAFIANGIMSNRIAHEHCVVAGNIHENPELLEVK